MGKRIIQQRRGRGTTTYRAHSHRWIAKVKHRPYDTAEINSIIKGKVIDLVHCSGHSAPLAQVMYGNKEQSYILAPQGLRVNDSIESGAKANVKVGNTLPLKKIPEGTSIYNIELTPGDGGKICRTSGNSAKIISTLGNKTLIQFPSKKQKKVLSDCRATIGIIAGAGRKDKPFVKAGKRHYLMRAKGKLYPITSAVAMNAVDHPFGSGRGRQHSKIKPPSRFAPPGRKVGPLRPKRTGRR